MDKKKRLNFRLNYKKDVKTSLMIINISTLLPPKLTETGLI